jgi:hypothetical protein
MKVSTWVTKMRRVATVQQTDRGFVVEYTPDIRSNVGVYTLTYRTRRKAMAAARRWVG